jgi:hypothetical protein
VLRTVVDSRSLSSVGYDAEQLVLEVEFRNGGVYRYVGVPRAIYEGLLTAESKGAYFNAVVREGFVGEQIR